MEPSHSVIVPARNAEATLAKALDSLLAQSQASWEAIIVDDCSTDATGRIASAYAAKDKRFFVLSGPAKGVSAARNVGLVHARGRRLVFLDSDDWVAPNFLSRLGDSLDAQPWASAAYCAYQRVTPQGLLTKPRLPTEVSVSAFEALARRSAIIIHSVLIDRQLVVELGGFDERLRTCEEWDLWQRAARAGARFVAVGEPLAFYRMSANSLSSDAETMVRDAAHVIGRGFSYDPRVRKPAAEHATGADPTYGTADLALALFTLWCAGYQVGRGADITAVLTAGYLVDFNDHFNDARDVILDSLIVGAGCTLPELAGRWPILEDGLTALLGRLEAASTRPGLKRYLQSELERRMLTSAELTGPLSLGLMAAVPFDVREPSPSFVPRQDVDRLLLRLQSRNKQLGTVELPIFGAASAYEFFSTLWCAGHQVGRGADIATVLTAGQLVDFNDYFNEALDVILDGLTVGAECTLPELAGHWHILEDGLTTLLGRLEAASPRLGLKRRVQYELERRMLNSAELTGPLSLGQTAAVPFDVRRPSSFVPRQDIERVLLRLHSGNKHLGTVELPVFGAASAYEIMEKVLDHLGLRTFVRETGAGRRPRAWLAGALELMRGLLAQPPRRPDLRALARQAIRTAALAHFDAPTTNGKQPAFYRPAGVCGQRHQMDAGRTAASTKFHLACAGSSRRKVFDRQAYWESVFERIDPWNYDSQYERLKRERMLSLVPPGVKRACELACAEGHFTEHLAKTVGHLTATDISVAALSRARARCATMTNVDFAQLDLVKDPLPEQVDLLVCSEVLYYLSNQDELAIVCSRLSKALSEGGRLLLAHSFVLSDDLSRTAFDWDHRYGAATIAEVLAATPGLLLETSLQTDLYRIDLFRHGSTDVPSPGPRIERLPLDGTLQPSVARQVVWGGAEIRRSEACERETAHSVPILMYHRVAEDGPPELARYRTPAAVFKAQMQWLRSHGYYAISTSQLAERMRNRAELPGRPVLISFDDGTMDFYDTAWPILRHCDLSAEVFVVTDMIGGHAVWDSDYGPPAPLMSEDQIASLASEGVRFGSHLATHRRADALSSAELLSELIRSRSTLETLTGATVTSFAAPYGVIDQRLLFLAGRCGYQIGLATHHGFAALDSELLWLPRIEIRGDWSLEQFADAVRGRANPCNDLVSVVIPACNAEDTIDETLRSVRAQTHRNIEIIVVDDGSEDKTPDIVHEHVRKDCRVSMIRQPNSGVAAARNRGARNGRGQFIAFIDADDLWSPDNIRKRLSALWAGGPQVGLVYSRYAVIDQSSRIVDTSYQPFESGNVLKRICEGNLVGNGSTALVTRAAFDAAGGFDPALRALGAQGCEDWQFYFKVAERYRFALVPEMLTGYRLRPGAMSHDLVRMLRSSTHLVKWMHRRQPRLRRSITRGSTFYARWLLATAFRQRRYVEAVKLALVLLRQSPARAARVATATARAAIRYRLVWAIKATFARRKCETPQDRPDALTKAFPDDPTKIQHLTDFIQDVAIDPGSVADVIETRVTPQPKPGYFVDHNVA
jgi:glycosyltransferase involved in cell wall biosynthesis/predicted TPR repeat methyltransferase